MRLGFTRRIFNRFHRRIWLPETDIIRDTSSEKENLLLNDANL
jgi:hypothetical protein